MTDTAADTAPVEETKDKKPKAEKAPKPQPPVYVGAAASREGTVYNRLQTLVAANPGLNRDQLIAKLQEAGFSAKNSRKFEENPTQFIGGYITAGERKGFFTFDESKAVATPNVAAVAKKEPAEKGPSVTETGKALLTALRDGMGEEFAVGKGLPLKTLVETLGKTKAQLSRTIDKLVKEKFIETDTVQDGDASVDFVYVEQAGYDLIAGAAAPAAE